MFLANVLQPLIGVEQWTLKPLHSIGLGWGLAIVGLTVLVRVCTLPLVVRQFRSQRELRKHMPQMKELQKRHKGDKERLQREMQAYYREHGINPLSAFAPLLVQIPVFISLYYLMRHDVKNGLFGDAGMLFIPHLTEKPHGAVLVALVLTYLVSQISGSLIATRSMQGGQRGLMLALPLLFVGIVARFPAGLAVYWITTSLWTLGQQVCFWRLGARRGARARRDAGARDGGRPRRLGAAARGAAAAAQAPDAQAQARPAPLGAGRRHGADLDQQAEHVGRGPALDALAVAHGEDRGDRELDVVAGGGDAQEGTLVRAAQQQPGGELVAGLEQVEHLNLDAREGRVEVLVEGDHAGLVHRLERDSAEHDVVGVEVEIAGQIALVGALQGGAVDGCVAPVGHGADPSRSPTPRPGVSLPSPGERP